MKMGEKSLTRYFQNASNKVLDLLSEQEKRKDRAKVFWTDVSLAAKVGVSSNLIQRVLAHLLGKGVVMKRERRWRLARPLRKNDYFDLGGDELSRAETVDNYCIQQLGSGRFRPGDRISELRLAREANVSTGSVRESLLRLSRLGVIQKNVRRQWQVV
jgi:DNA-binding GntR family transcriptional regulator